MSAHTPASLDSNSLRVGAWVRLKDRNGRPKVPIVEIQPKGMWVELNGYLIKVSPDQVELLPAMRRT